MERMPEHTNASFEGVKGALVDAWTGMFGAAPSVATQVVVCAHSAFETGRWSAMMNNNIGNAKGKPSETSDYTYFPTKEYLPEPVADVFVKKSTVEAMCEIVGTIGSICIVKFYPKHPVCCFRSFETLSDGMKDHLRLLSGRYKEALDGSSDGCVDTYATSLRAHGYFTGPLVNYISGMNRFFDEFAMRVLGHQPTVDGIKAYQSDKGISVDGDIGRETRGKLREDLQNLSVGC